MQESIDSHQTSGESCLLKAPAESGRSLDGPGVLSGKSKKRERPDQNSTAGTKVQLTDECNNPQKRECAVNLVDDGGGLANTAAVEQFLLRMKQGKLSSSQRSAVAKILVATSNDDVLKKFVFLGGVSTLEEWIQEGAKIRSTDTVVKESDKALDEEIMMILQALEKLPISLETLKGCSIGKSVKQLRSVRNGEIQKKAKKLVDTWRKRVDLEIKQSCTQPSVAATERSQQIDVMSHASDQSPSKMTEACNGVAVKSAAIHVIENSDLLKSQTLQSNFFNGEVYDGSPKEHSKSSPEKDASKKIARLPVSSFTSVTVLTASKKQKLSTDKDEPSNFFDYQNLEEKHVKGETSSNHAATDVAVKKTNEYRKKLRSGGSIALPCSTESNAVGLPGNAVQIRENNSEKATCIDSDVCDSEQRRHAEQHNPCLVIGSAGEHAAYEAPDPPSINDRDAADKDGNASYLHVQGVKVEHMNESCLSSQSSCSNKRNFDGPNGLIVEKTSLTTSPFQGDGKVCPSASHFSEQANDLFNGRGVVQGSSKSLSSENNHADVFAHKLSPKAEPNPTSESVVNIGSERNRSTNATRGVEIGAADREESCCSHNTQMYRDGGADILQVPDEDENAQLSAEHSPTQLSVLEAVGTRDGAACSETTKFLSYSCQELENANLIKVPTLSNGHMISNLTGETNKVQTAPTEIPLFTQSCHDFDLNEGLAMEDFGHDTQPSCGPPSSTSCVVPKVTGTLSAPIAVSAATKGAFIPSLNTPSKSDIGWRGSAATSAFRPAEPRHASVKVQTATGSATTEARNVNSFDLNVTDHDSFEDPPILACQGLQEVRLDLNHDGKVNHTMTSILQSSKRPHVGSPGNCREKRAMLDFDLNEELNEVPKEQVILPPSAVKAHDGLNTYRGLPETGAVGDYALWNSAEGSFYPGSAAAIGPKFELFCSGSSGQSMISARQATPAFVPPPSTSFVFSQAPPFFGGSQQPFPASFTYNPMSAGLDTSFMVSRGFPETSFVVSKGISGSVGSPMDVRSRPEMPVRPTFLANMDNVRGGNNLFAWGRAPQNIYGNPGAAMISYNDATVGGSEHVVNVDRHASLEEQMRVFQHPVVPVSSLKRREPDYFPGLKQTTWN